MLILVHIIGGGIMFYFNCCLYLRLGDIHSFAQGLMLSILFCDGQNMYVLQFLFSKYSGLFISLTPFSRPGSALAAFLAKRY